MTVFGLRVCCPDRPGNLGALATALGQAGVNIVSVDVVDRSEGIAADQLVVETADLGLRDLVEAVESVPDIVVELVHTMPEKPHQQGSLALAVQLHDAEDVLETLTTGVVEVLHASWCVALRQGGHQPEVLGRSPDAPALTDVETPWLPVSAPRHVTVGSWVPAEWPLDPVSAAFAVAPLRSEHEALLVARTSGPVFRAGELDALGHLTGIAARVVSARRQAPSLGAERG